MKTIKFRRPFYNYKTKSFSHFSIWGVNIDYANFINPATNNKCYNKEDEQFTGLKDKNNKEVYKGDLLKNTRDQVGEVVWYEAGFYLKAKRTNGSIFFIPLTNGFIYNKEIVGNIHENKELLK